jgi:hypothetical protein
MKGLVISAFAALAITVGWSPLSITPAKAYYSPPRCVTINGYTYCLTKYYSAPRCVYRSYHGVSYIYCRS